MAFAVVIVVTCGPALLNCSDLTNAVLEVELTLPSHDAADPGERYAYVQFRAAQEYPFSVGWERTDAAGYRLTTSPQAVTISLVADRQPGDINVRIRFCTQADCGAVIDGNAPERQFTLEHPLYLGKRTFWTVTVEQQPLTTPDTPTTVPKCAIKGCLDGDVAMYCHDGVHFCED